jgi:diacylglycerol O-acyltransferase
MPDLRQLSSLDANFLAMESARTFGHVGGITVLDPSTAPGDALTLDDLRRLVANRLAALPPFRWKLVPVPFALDHPYWIEDPDFDLDFHIRESAVPPPGTDAQLAETVARIFARPLDRSRPLWELYLIHGLGEDRVALLTKVHHSAVDGVSGAEIMGILYDLEHEAGRPRRSDAADPGTVGTTPARQPTEAEMFIRGVGGLTRYPFRALRTLPRTLRVLPRMPGLATVPAAPTLTRGVARLSRSGADGGVLEVSTARAPRLSFNTTISTHRSLAFRSLSLQDVKAVKNELGITVNDVIVGLCAGALRTWLSARDELPDVPLVAMIPTSVRTDAQRGEFGNRVSTMVVPIPTDVADPRDRLGRAHEVLKVAKERYQALPASLLTDTSIFIPPALHVRAARATAEVMGRLRTPVNLILSNVPGPADTLYCAGAELLANYPLSVVTDGVGLNITALSYRDHVDFGVTADRASIDDAWPLIDALQAELSGLCDLTGLSSGV